MKLYVIHRDDIGKPFAQLRPCATFDVDRMSEIPTMETMRQIAIDYRYSFPWAVIDKDGIALLRDDRF